MSLDLSFPVRFVKPIIPKESGGFNDNLGLPLPFLEKFGDVIPPIVIVVTRSGEEQQLKFSKDEGALIGIRNLLCNLFVKPMQIVLFEYNNDYKFHIYLLDSGDIVQPRPGLHAELVCMFAEITLTISSQWKRLKLPSKFLSKYRFTLETKVMFKLGNGKVVEGLYDSESGTVSGLQQVYKMYYMSIFETIVFSYHGSSVFDVFCFGRSCVEKADLSHCVGYFVIEIKPSHLQKYDFGVTISAKFKDVIDSWGAMETISARHASSSWDFLVRKRSGRVEIVDGWCLFWNEMQLRVGDIFLFKRGSSANVFELEVYKHSL